MRNEESKNPVRLREPLRSAYFSFVKDRQG